jgi:hypothetical protein
LSLNASAAEDSYKIQLVRPYKVGDKYATELEATYKTMARSKVNAFVGKASGTVTVLAVNEKTGRTTQLSCTVDALTKDGKSLYPTGTVLTGQKENHASRFTINGQPASKEETQLLEALFDLGDPNETVSEDQISGATEAKKVGASWQVDRDAAAAGFKEDRLDVSSENVQGDSTLVKLEKADGIDAMVFRSDITAKTLKGPTGSKAKIIGGTFEEVEEVVLPLDPSLPAISGVATGHLIEIDAGPTGSFRVSVDIKLKFHNRR